MSVLGDALLVDPDPDTGSALLALDARLDLLEASWLSHTPVLTAATTDPTLGTGSIQSGRYLFVPATDLVIYRWFIQFGSSGADPGSGVYSISVPVNISVIGPASTTFGIGSVVIFDWSVAGHKELAIPFRASSTTIGLYVDDATVAHNNPIPWTNDDRMGGTVIYQAA